MKGPFERCPLKDDETSSLLLDYSAGRLDAAEAVTLERHMDSCAECALFRSSQSAVWDALDAWEPPMVSADFNRRLWQRIASVKPAPWYRRIPDTLGFIHWKPAVPLAAAVLVVLAGFLLDHPGTRPQPSGNSATPSVSVTEADQLEQTLDDVQLLNQFNASSEKADSKPL